MLSVKKSLNCRQSGILLPISALPSPWGIGTLGKAAYAFADFLAQSGQRFWQVLPVGPISYGDSPYQSFSSYAGNPYLIDLDLLAMDGLLLPQEYQPLSWGDDPCRIDYAQLFNQRFVVLQKAYDRGWERDREAVAVFIREQAGWLPDYALFMALKRHFSFVPYTEWPIEIRLRRPDAVAAYRQKLAKDIHFFIYLQFLFFRQWDMLRAYVHQNGIQLIGDLPIYAAGDSADTWADPEIFWLDADCRPVRVAGCPPDAFSENGQLWGNPVYRWDVLKERGYDWWLRRVAAAGKRYDILRLDHFRGFESFYAIPAGDTTAKNGVWLPGPGIELFRLIRKQEPNLQIIAEDLGFLTPGVRRLLRQTGYPGMKVLLFGLYPDSDSSYLPHHIDPKSVAYIGTHDNDTVLGWIQQAPLENVCFARAYMHLTQEEGYHWGMIRTLLSTRANTVILQMQDLLGLDNTARMNLPSTVGGNWVWRMPADACTQSLAEHLYQMTRLYGRI
ncbi:MAG TPA: 4-alpha-glucanotransferase [Firmicutes bacterium]|nr:4-alpha-glucanotransferase [Bacillota bacterium]